MLKAIRSTVLAVSLCFTMVASAQGKVTVDKDGSVQVTKGNKKVTIQDGTINVGKGGKTVEINGAQVNVEDDDGDTAVVKTGSGGTEESADANLELNGTGQKKTIRCEDKENIELNGTSNTLTFVGDCGDIEVNGTANTLKIEAAARIDISGTGNVVTYKRGVGRAKPKISNSGLNNTVTQEK